MISDVSTPCRVTINEKNQNLAYCGENVTLVKY